MAREGFLVYHEMLSWLEPYGDAERGRLLTAMLTYSITGEAPGLSGNERFLWPAIRDKIDRDRESYESTCKKNRQNVEKRWNTEGNDGIRPNTTVYDKVPDVPTVTVTETVTKQKQKPKSPAGESAHARGEYGWVKLTDSQYEKLLKDLGQEELDRCIQYVDESAQKTHNKNKWTDWNLVIRSCHRDGWGMDWQEHAQKKPKQYTTAAEYKNPSTNIDADKIRQLEEQMASWTLCDRMRKENTR